MVLIAGEFEASIPDGFKLEKMSAGVIFNCGEAVQVNISLYDPALKAHPFQLLGLLESTSLSTFLLSTANLHPYTAALFRASRGWRSLPSRRTM